MRKQATVMALLAATAAMAAGNSKMANNIEMTAREPFYKYGSPHFMPTRSQRIKNKQNRKRYGRS